jgi:hypothetical protein
MAAKLKEVIQAVEEMKERHVEEKRAREELEAKRRYQERTERIGLVSKIWDKMSDFVQSESYTALVTHLPEWKASLPVWETKIWGHKMPHLSVSVGGEPESSSISLHAKEGKAISFHYSYVTCWKSPYGKNTDAVYLTRETMSELSLEYLSNLYTHVSNGAMEDFLAERLKGMIPTIQSRLN